MERVERITIFSDAVDNAELLKGIAKLKFCEAVIYFGINGEEPDFSDIPEQDRPLFFQLWKYTKMGIEGSRTHYLNGKKGAEFGALGAEYGSKGGRPRKTPLKTPQENPLENPPTSTSNKEQVTSSKSKSKKNQTTPRNRGNIGGGGFVPFAEFQTPDLHKSNPAEIKKYLYQTGQGCYFDVDQFCEEKEKTKTAEGAWTTPKGDIVQDWKLLINAVNRKGKDAHNDFNYLLNGQTLLRGSLSYYDDGPNGEHRNELGECIDGVVPFYAEKPQDPNDKTIW